MLGMSRERVCFAQKPIAATKMARRFAQKPIAATKMARHYILCLEAVHRHRSC
jgi:hypothetical protein